MESFLWLFFFKQDGKPLSVADQAQAILHKLEPEIEKSFAYFNSSNQGQARAIADALVTDLPDLRDRLLLDVEAIFEGDPAATSREEVILAYPGIRAIAAQRIAHRLYRMNAPLIPRMMTEWAHEKTGIDIHPGARIGASFCIDHGTGIVIGETCEIGNHVKIYHSVTLGARSTAAGHKLSGRKRHPTIEDHVTLYPGVTILGGDTVIGAGCTIGGNVFLMQSIPPHHLVFHQEEALCIKPKPDASKPG